MRPVLYLIGLCSLLGCEGTGTELDSIGIQNPICLFGCFSAYDNISGEGVQGDLTKTDTKAVTGTE